MLKRLAIVQKMSDGVDVHVGPLIGAGSQAHVFRAWSSLVQKPIALKCIEYREGEGWDSIRRPLVERVWEEAQILSRAANRHLPEMFGVGTVRLRDPVVPGCPATMGLIIAMELIEGCTGRDLQGRLTWEQAFRVGHDVASGMLLSRQAVPGLGHRDLKPGNIRLESVNGELSRAVLLDFGTAKSSLRELRNADDTIADTAVGSLDYMPPECFKVDDTINLDTGDLEARDVYSLGMTLISLVDGKPPRPRRLESYQKVWREFQGFPSFVLAMIHPDPKMRPRWRDVVKTFRRYSTLRFPVPVTVDDVFGVAPHLSQGDVLRVYPQNLSPDARIELYSKAPAEAGTTFVRVPDPSATGDYPAEDDLPTTIMDRRMVDLPPEEEEEEETIAVEEAVRWELSKVAHPAIIGGLLALCGGGLLFAASMMAFAAVLLWVGWTALL